MGSTQCELDLAKFCPFGKMTKVFGYFWRLYLVFAQKYDPTFTKMILDNYVIFQG